MSQNKLNYLSKIFTTHLLLLLLTSYLWGFLSKEAIASGTSYDEELVIIPLGNNCSTIKPIATYSLRNGETEGILYATICNNVNRLPNPLVDYVRYKFIDTGGSNPERCYGIVDTSTPSGIQYSWKFLGAVPNYSCSNINQTIHKLFPKGY